MASSESEVHSKPSVVNSCGRTRHPTMPRYISAHRERRREQRTALSRETSHDLLAMVASGAIQDDAAAA